MTLFKSRLVGFSVLLCSALLGLRADSLIIPHLADGGGWKTTLVLTNTSASPATVKLVFHEETSNGATQSWNPPFVEVSSTDSVAVQGGATAFLHTTGTSNGNAGAVGWGEVQTTGAVQVYAVFTSSATQEGTAPASAGASRLLMPFDNTGGRFTALALATNSTSDQAVGITIRTNDGTITKGALGVLPAMGHTSFLLATKFTATNNQQGLLEITGALGGISGIGLRFNANGAFTSAPMYPQSGSPIIGSTGGGAAQVSGLTFASSSVASGGSLQGTVTLNAAAPSGGASVALSSSSSAITVPATVTVAAGATSATFTATAGSVTADQSATVSAKYGGNTAQAQITVTASAAGTTVSFSSLTGAPLTFQPVGYSSSEAALSCTPDAGNIVLSCNVTFASAGVVALKGTSSDHGTTFLFTQVDSTTQSPNVFIIGSTMYTISSANLSFTLTQTAAIGSERLGNLNGTLTVVGTPFESAGDPVTMSGVLKGQYFTMQ